MNPLSQPLFYATLMLLAGIGIPIMAALNGGLGARLQSPLLATVILFAVGLSVSLLVLLMSEGVPRFEGAGAIPRYFYFGGLFVIFYILSITWVAPRFGIGNAIAFVLLGQLVSMSIIDHFSLLGAQNYPMTLQRGLGLVFMAIGVFLVVRKS